MDGVIKEKTGIGRKGVRSSEKDIGRRLLGLIHIEEWKKRSEDRMFC